MHFLLVEVNFNSFQFIQIFYYAIAIIGFFVQEIIVDQLREYMFASLVIPLGIIVFAMYWGLLLLNNDLVFPVPKEEYIKFPLWYDFIMHINVAILPFVDMLLSTHAYPNRILCIITLLGVLAAYLSFLLVIHRQTGKWVYGILDKCGAFQRTLLFGGVGAITVVFLLFGEMCNRMIGEMKKS